MYFIIFLFIFLEIIKNKFKYLLKLSIELSNINKIMIKNKNKLVKINN